MEDNERQMFQHEMSKISNELEEVKEENVKLKELLKLAYNDIKDLFRAGNAEYQRHDSLDVPEFCKLCKYYTEIRCSDNAKSKCYTWRHEDKLRELVEIEENSDEKE